jgi:hypothetical protein
MITAKRIPEFIRMCLEDLVIIPQEDKTWLVAKCNLRYECNGCPMCDPEYQLILDYSPNNIIKVTEITSDWEDREEVSGMAIVNDKPYVGPMIVYKESALEKLLKPYQDSPEQWYYYTAFICDEHTLVVYQLKEA